MGKYKDRTGEKYNRWTFISYDHTSGSKTYWLCRCDCGTEKVVQANHIITGESKSCGCLNAEVNSELFTKDITGQRFGKLVALEPTDKRYLRNVVWKCICDCGNYCEVSEHRLVDGNTQSCGCVRSRGEQKIAHLLQEANIPFQKEYYIKYEDGTGGRLDFYVDNRYAIEFDGLQHFDESNWWFHPGADEKKNKYCKENNIPLIRIPYTKLETLSLSDLII